MTRITEKGAHKSIAFIIDNGNSDISYAGRTCNKHSYTKRYTQREREDGDIFKRSDKENKTKKKTLNVESAKTE